MRAILIVATLLGVIFTLFVLVAIYWITIMALFITLPSDKVNKTVGSDNDVNITGSSISRRFEQGWIQSYLPNTASVLQIAGTVSTMVNVQAKLAVDAQKEKHVLLNANIDAIDELMHVKEKDDLKTKIVHGVVADAGKPVSFLSRNYAITDYYGKIREPIEKYQEYTIAQLENLHGIQFDAIISETWFQTTGDIESFLKQLKAPTVFFMFHIESGAIQNSDEFKQMLLKYKLRVAHSHRGTWVCLPVPPPTDNSSPINKKDVSK